jgi:amidase
MLDAYDVVDGVEPEPPARERVAHRRPGPDEDPDNAWVLRTEIRTTESGPLAGLRVAVKDSIMVAGLPMAAGSGLLAGYRPSFDATAIGLMLVGRHFGEATGLRAARACELAVG